jgi:alpha-glucosidase
MLNLYRAALALRRSEPALCSDDFAWAGSGLPGTTLAFRRGTAATGQLVCIVNFGDLPVDIPSGHELVLASDPETRNQVGPDVAVWLRPNTTTTIDGEKQI